MISIQKFLRRPRAKWISMGIVACFAGCGGGGGGGSSTDRGPTTGGTVFEGIPGSVYPAVTGLVFIEYGADGAELQRSTATAADGSFRLAQPLSGTRLQALRASSENRVAPLYSAPLRAGEAQPSRIQVTALTTWYDQLLAHDVAAGTAAGQITALVGGSCLPDAGTQSQSQSQSQPQPQQAGNYVYADAILPGKNHDWLLSAVSAYLQATREVGLGPQVDFTGWSEALGRHGGLLTDLCSYSSKVSAAAWKTAQVTRLRDESQVQQADSAKLSAAIADARTQGLALLARRMQVLQYPEQTQALQSQAAAFAGQELSLSSDFVVAQYLHGSVAALGLVTPPTTTSLAVTSSGEIVSTVQASATASDTPPRLRLWNQSAADKRVRLTLNGQNMADLNGVLEQILALPVAYTDEPLYRKAWRYVIAHRRRTVPVAIGNFQYQPDLWLRSIGSSFCEAQATALYFIWQAMGYEARVMGLSGHVTPEIKIDGRWQIFDPYLATYYTDRSGKQIVGVAEIEKDPSLVSNPATPLLPLTDTAYSQEVAAIYGSTEDNFLMYWVMTPTVKPMGSELQIPAGGYAEFDAAGNLMRPSTETGQQVDMAQMRLWLPPGYSGTIKLPLLLVDVQGAGQVQLLGQSLDPSGTDAKTLLDNFLLSADAAVGVTELAVDSVGPGGLTLTMMVNPLYFGTGQQLTVRAYGPDTQGLSFGGETATQAL